MQCIANQGKTAATRGRSNLLSRPASLLLLCSAALPPSLANANINTTPHDCPIIVLLPYRLGILPPSLLCLSVSLCCTSCSLHTACLTVPPSPARLDPSLPGPDLNPTRLGYSRWKRDDKQHSNQPAHLHQRDAHHHRRLSTSSMSP